MKLLNKTIFENVISLIVFIIIIVALTFIITLKILQNNVYNVYKEDNFMIELEPKINKTLDKLSDIDGLNSKFNKVNITNNNVDTRKYKILITPLNNDASDIRLSVDNYLIRNLSSFDKQNDSYIIYESSLEPQKSILHQIRVWQSKKSQKDNINVNFKIYVIIL